MQAKSRSAFGYDMIIKFPSMIVVLQQLFQLIMDTGTLEKINNLSNFERLKY
jgi:mannitol/fructose-specific phosphotransferase system IIA component (Ntr-type)